MINIFKRDKKTAEESEQQMTIESCANDMEIQVQLVGAEDHDNIYVVDGVVQFHLYPAFVQGSEGLYTLYYFVNDQLKRKKDNISMPYNFKQTYKGMKQQQYELYFLITDESGHCGMQSIIIEVKH